MKAEWVALALADEMTPKLFRTLIELFGSVENVLSASPEEIVAAGADRATAVSIRERCKHIHEVERMLDDLRNMDVDVLTLCDDSYPFNLRLIDDAPPVIFVRGQILPFDVRAVAIVGSRMATSDGLKLAKRMAIAFVKHGWTVVSGLAAGIDTEAHIGAIEGGGRTIAALGSGILVPENPQLASRIERGGALISEFHPAAGVSVKNWLRRNRLVTGMSIGTVMIEGAEKSGTAHAAATALKQGRLLFVVSWGDNLPVHMGNEMFKSRATLVTPPDESRVEEMCRLMERKLQSMHVP